MDRLRLVLAGAGLTALLAGAPACDRSESRLPTEPPRSAPEAAQPAVERMPIVLVPRRKTSSPTPAATQTATALTATPTPTPTPLPPPPTATPAPPIAIRLRGISWQWDFYGAGAVNGGPEITLRRNQPYEIELFNDGPMDSSFHTFGGIAALGLSGVSISPGETAFQTFTPLVTGEFRFNCTNSACGIGHDNMLGTIRVVP